MSWLHSPQNRCSFRTTTSPRYTQMHYPASMATQKVSDTQETADNPCLTKWSTFTGADQAPDFAGAAVEAVLRLVLPPAVVEVDPVVELEPNAALRSPIG